jgi:proton-coupled amino acid transporter
VGLDWSDVADSHDDDETDPEPEPPSPQGLQLMLEPVDLGEPVPQRAELDSMRNSVSEQEGLLGSGSDGYSESPVGRIEAPSGATLGQTYVTFFKSFVGIAILGLPHAFSLAGYILAPLVFAFIAYISFYCMRLLLVTKNKILANAALSSSLLASEGSGESTDAKVSPTVGGLVMTNVASGMGYQDVARACLGPCGQQLTEFCLVTSQAGFLIGYFIFIGQNTPPSLVRT